MRNMSIRIQLDTYVKTIEHDVKRRQKATHFYRQPSNLDSG